MKMTAVMANYNFQIFKQIFFTDKMCIYDA